MLSVPLEYQPLIKQASVKRRVPAMMLAGLCKQESDFDPTCKSYNKSDDSWDRGICQINNKAFPYITDAQAFDPAFAIDWAAQHLRNLHDSGCVNWYETLLAYNGGMGAVYAYRKGQGYNLSYADDIFELSGLSDIATYTQNTINVLGGMWKIDLFGREEYHQMANGLRDLMGWDRQ